MQREKKYTVHTVEHWAGKAARLASWRKMTQPGKFCFVGDGIFRVFPVRAHFIFPGMPLESLKVQKIEIFLASVLKFVLFLY